MAILLKITAHADAKKESVTKASNGRLIINVRQPAEGNRANKRIIEMVRLMYPGAAVRLVSGHHKPSKIVSVGV